MHGTVRAKPLREHGALAKRRHQEGGKRFAGGIVDGGMQAQAMRARNKVAAVQAMLGSTTSAGAVTAVGSRRKVRGRHQHRHSKGGAEVGGMVEGGGVGGGDTVEPRGWARSGGPVKKAGAANLIGVIVETQERQRVKHCCDSSLSVWVRAILNGVWVRDGSIRGDVVMVAGAERYGVRCGAAVNQHGA